MNWQVLEWNKLARDFYDYIGAELLDKWRLCRLEGDRLLELCGQELSRAQKS